jgi:hypothetical protein
VLLKLSARWLVLTCSPQRSIPESFVRGIVDSGIRPVIWIKARVGETSPRDLAPLLTSYAAWGVREVVVLDRPNQRASWRPAEWARPDLVERFVDHFLPYLQLQRSLGLNPVFPPLEPGGDYWDTAFLESALRSVQRRGQESLLRRMTLAVYAWTYGRALDWGYGGPANWPEAVPYETLEGIQDQIGFRTSDWYAAIAKSLLGDELPMLVIAGGPGSGSTGPEVPAHSTSEILRTLLDGELSEAVQAFCFYLLAGDEELPVYPSGWFASPTEPRPLVASAKRLIDAASTPLVLRADKPLKHYVLLPADSPSEESWRAARELARDSVVGFSADEAAQASRVTLVGDEAAIPPSVERKLARAGCQVARIHGRPAPIPEGSQRKRT